MRPRKQRIVAGEHCLIDIDKIQGGWASSEEALNDLFRATTTHSDVLMLVFDVGNRETLVKLVNNYPAIQRFLDSADRCRHVVIVGAKADIPVEEREISVEKGMQVAAKVGAMYRECSAKERIGVEELVDDVAKVVLAERERLRVLALKDGNEDLTDVSGKYGDRFWQRFQGWLKLESARRK
ncbi:uncharacterized protein BDZ99DRAFT_456878 [Mytilinidion resinicola]|uniref:Ras-domain-containing protein n=1 Tax=Mytilinidion resinicola TaxID=574789 RepID=A0A6A6Z7K3_9PEZI|nr:uncharacterized protein BDZ99DRAFT_456878 [Mytilinidion resinicola]KAF2817082.1 hypothetical protein BDZ99DRAFT_456878 [Mytilinidion resinicola]